MKKCLSLLTIFLLICSALSFGASAATEEFEIEDGVLIHYLRAEKEVLIPDGVYAIADSAFEGNKTLERLILPASLIEIGERAFAGCTSLVAVAGGENVYEVGARAFDDTPYLTRSSDEFLILGRSLLWYNGTSDHVTLPDSVYAVAPYAFLRCEGLRSFSAGEELSMIGEGAFYECTSLASVEVTDALQSVGACVFDGTPFLDNGGMYAVIGDGILIACHDQSASLTIPQGIRVIAPRVFYQRSDLSAVKVPSSVYHIGAQAFSGCASLNTLTLSTGLISIGEEAFSNCKKLYSLSTPSTLSFIDKGAFLNCTSLESLSLCGSSLSVNYGAFAYCSSLRTVLMSSGVSLIYDKAFYSDIALKAVSVSAQTLKISATSFEGCPSFLLSTTENSFVCKALGRISKIHTDKGDADRDGKLSVLDATKIQKRMASLTALDEEASSIADIDFDGSVTVLDAARIQKILAKII